MSRFRSSGAPGGGRPGARAGKSVGPGAGDAPGDEQASPGGEPAAAPDAVLRAELARLLAAERAPEARDALDVLYIARLSGLDPVDWTHLGDGTDPTPPAPPADSLPPSPPADEPTPAPGPAPVLEQLTAQLHLPGGTGGTAPARPGGAHAIRVAQPPALPDPLSLTRALRPLRRWVPSPHARVLDVEATAAASGEIGLLLPVLRPAAERRFSVDLLIDTGTTMTVWHRLAGELRTLLARHGAFADVRAWALHTDGPEPTLAPFRSGTRAASPTRRWRQALADPAGRRAVLVLTDAVGPAWYGTELPAALADWSRRRPVAALQVLPSRLWHRTALGTSPVRARGTEAASATLEVRSSGPLPGIPRGRAGAADRERIRWLPVLEADDAWLAPWARLVSGRTTDWVPLHAAPLTVVERPRPVGPSEEPATPAAWVEHFEEGYSPEAFRLLRLLAAAPLSLPVMRLVQRAMLPSSTHMHLAEIFLSGLLVRRTPPGPGEDPDRVLYDFRPGVREALLGRLTRTESLRVLRRVLDGVSERVAATFGGVTDFGALVAAVGAEGDGALDGLELPEESRAFAEVAVAVIGGVGGDYKEVAARLGVRGSGAAARGVPAEAEPEPEPEVVEGRRSRWLPWRRRARSIVAGAGGGGVNFPGGRGRSNEWGLPELPAPYTYVRSDAVGLLVRRLLAISPRTVGGGYPLSGPTTWLIEGGQGTGKTTLAVDCARRMTEDFTLVRWIRAHSREVLLEELNTLADDLGIPAAVPRTRLLHLHDHLRAHPGWLLIYDGVTQQTLQRDDRVPESWWNVCLPPRGYGALLVTLSGGTRWPDSAYERVTLGDLHRDEAISYLARSLESQHGELWHNSAELADLVEVAGGNLGRLSEIGAMLTAARRPVGHYVHEVLARRVGDKFLRSLVWISRDGEFLVTGIAVTPDVVLAPQVDPLRHGMRVHRHDGADFAAVMGRVGSAGPAMMRLDLVEGALPAMPPARPDSSPVVAAWYEQHERTGVPVLTLRPASSKPHPPPGAVLIDADGRLCSVVAWSAEGPTRGDVTPEFIDRQQSEIAARDPGPPRRLLVWPEPNAVMREALLRHRYQPIVVSPRGDVQAQLAAHPSLLFVDLTTLLFFDLMTRPVTRTALLSMRHAAVAAEVPVLVTAGLGHTEGDASYGTDPAVLFEALAPRDSEHHPPRVLLIEEHAEIALALTSKLERRGMQVARAEADNAMIVASELRPNMVSINLMQVHQEGHRIVHWLREYGLLNHTPIVAYTAAVAQAGLPRLASGETELYLTERANSHEVRARVVELLARIGFD
ncbi:SAV_2336 N-terminal domain-related protein [Streptomyces sp. NPDC005526]|uniref:SAV_2336 N-terminal domain-related protein n=1 Tax=Streptomyces sp. NPDC005526 TaxID=3156885 RepID=UPI0033AA423A